MKTMSIRCTCPWLLLLLLSMKTDTQGPMTRKIVLMPEDLISAVDEIARAEKRSFADVLRDLARTGLMMRQDNQEHTSRLMRTMERLELQCKEHDQRIAALEAGRSPARTKRVSM